jgi:hypothetical protein
MAMNAKILWDQAVAKPEPLAAPLGVIRCVQRFIVRGKRTSRNSRALRSNHNRAQCPVSCTWPFMISAGVLLLAAVAYGVLIPGSSPYDGQVTH